MSRYYNVDLTLSRNRLFNFVVGMRGVGKTYSSKRRAIKNYLQKGKQFVYLRRYDTELKKSEMSKFFDDIYNEFPDTAFKVGDGAFFINNKVAGWYMPLSKSQLFKSVPFPNVSLIIFDEFIIDVGTYRYLPNEVTTFLEAYSTISRDRDIPVLFLSNAITFTNPYFLYFNLSLEDGQHIRLLPDISLEVIENIEYVDHMSKTRFGRLTANTAYGNYAFKNEFLRDTDNFLATIPSTSRYVCTLVFETNVFGVYYEPVGDMYYVSEKIDHTCKIRLTIEQTAHKEDTVFIRNSNVIIKTLSEYFGAGRVRFETMKAKNIVYKIFKRML